MDPVAYLVQSTKLGLQEPHDNTLSSTLITATSSVIETLSSLDDPDPILNILEDDLQNIYDEFPDEETLHTTQTLLDVLYLLKPILPATSIITRWFDVVLRPALRETRLPSDAVYHAKELILIGLQNANENNLDKVVTFRQRLLDLYLLDAFNEISGEEILEWAKLDESSREIRKLWKSNLEDTLIKFGNENPQEFMTQINESYAVPSSRLQLLLLLSRLTSLDTFASSAQILAGHPLLTSLLRSLLLDNSSTLCTVGITLCSKLLPLFAVHAPSELKAILPKLLTILARISCWRERTPQDVSEIDPDVEVVDNPDDEDVVLPPTLELRPDFGWTKLELTFDASPSTTPPIDRLFTILYYLYPCNLMRFLRRPIYHLLASNLPSPYTVGWADALDEQLIRSRCKRLITTHTLHPLIIWRSAEEELNHPDFWRTYDVARITSEALMLNTQNARLGCNERTEVHSDGNRATRSMAENIRERAPISPGPNAEGSSSAPANSEEATATSPIPDYKLPSHVAQAISDLQREVIHLRNELNFEVWLSRENVRHIGRLHQDQILSKNAEMERQGLHNKLRNYKSHVTRLEKELRDKQDQSLSARKRYANWNTDLQATLQKFRDEKKAHLAETAALRAKEQEAQARYEAQGLLLTAANKEVFELKTQIKENQHKIDRLHDYEKQIEALVKVERTWDEEFRKFNARAEEMNDMMNRYHVMEERLRTLELTHISMDDTARAYRRQIQSLELRLAQTQQKNDNAKSMMFAKKIASFAQEKANMSETNQRLRAENGELQEEIEELQAMVEMLKVQINGRKGLVSEPRADSPLAPHVG